MSSYQFQLRKSPDILLGPSQFDSAKRNQYAVGQSNRKLCNGMSRFVILIALLGAAAIVSQPRPAAAQTTFQWNTLSPFWHITFSWFPLGLPSTNDTALFDIVATDSVTWNATTGNRTTGRLDVVAGNYTFDNVAPSQFQLSLNSSAFSPLRVNGPNTTLTINGLHFNATASNALVGNGATLNVGVGSGGAVGRITSSSFFRNDGTFNILNGALVFDSTGEVGSGSTNIGVTTVAGTNSRWTHSGTLSIGSNGNGTLNLENGGVVVNTTGFLGQLAGSSGTATVSGFGSQWANSENLNVGASGTGTLVVENFGRVSNITGLIGQMANSTGTATVTGVDSVWLNTGNLIVGVNGIGALNVENGGEVVSNNTGFVGSNPQSGGMVTVRDAGSQWNNSQQLFVGSSGFGILNVENGGVVASGNGVIGKQSVSSGLMAIADDGSSWTSNNLTVGELGEGALTVENGGTVALAGMLLVGDKPNSFGDVILSGNNTHLAAQQLVIGNEGNGLFIVENQATATCEQATIGAAAGSTGTLRIHSAGVLVNGGISNNGSIELTGNANIVANVVNSASIQTLGSSDVLLSGDLLHQGTLIETAGFSRTRIAGIAEGNGPYTGSGLVQFDGRFEPGFSGPGQISFAGSVELATGAALQIQLSGIAPNSNDRLMIAGALTIEPQRTLEVALINGFTIAAGQQFVIAEVGTELNGQFAGLAGGSLVGSFGGTELFISYAGGNGNDIVLYTIGLLGDANGDGVVSLLDVSAFVDALTSGVFVPEADINRDGVVSLLDVSPFVALLTG